MKHLRTILLFLLLGAVVNVGVAWGLALYVNTYKFESYDALDKSHAAWWREHVPSTWKDTPGRVEFRPAIGADSYQYTEGSGQILFSGVNRYLAGLPLRSMEGAVYIDRRLMLGWPDGQKHFERIWIIPYGRLPLRVRWPQTVVNAAFYAVLLWLIPIGPFTLRRHLRRRRGLCVKCAYDLKGAAHEVCPECGMGVARV